MVECYLAKVEVAGSSPVYRSIKMVEAYSKTFLLFKQNVDLSKRRFDSYPRYKIAINMAGLKCWSFLLPFL